MFLDQMEDIDRVLGEVGRTGELFPPEKPGDLLTVQISVGLLQSGRQLEVLGVEISEEERYPAFSLVELLHCCALIGRELQSVEIFSCTERPYYRRS